MELLSAKMISIKEGIRKSEEILLRKSEDLREELDEPLEIERRPAEPEPATIVKRGRPPKIFRLKDYASKAKTE